MFINLPVLRISNTMQTPLWSEIEQEPFWQDNPPVFRENERSYGDGWELVALWSANIWQRWILKQKVIEKWNLKEISQIDYFHQKNVFRNLNTQTYKTLVMNYLPTKRCFHCWNINVCNKAIVLCDSDAFVRFWLSYNGNS